ncbi:hypothetical protein [Sphingomonas sp. KR3-1]|uniref:hypothetical protein n=1 Tax=Sphingomonas sp. KR3-1 TaxID=3156611 RepID=UPI0032B4C726
MVIGSPFPRLQATQFGRHALGMGAAFVILASAGTAKAQRAGSEVRNVATATLQADGTPNQIASNAATLRVEERLDVRLAATGSGAELAGTGSAAPFLLTNAGNGDERFVLASTLDGITGTVRGFAIDRNANGLFDAGDTLVEGPTPSLAPGATLALLALFDPGQMTGSGALNVFARALTGSGAPGTVYPGRGDAGTDAIVGNTTAEATLRLSLVPGAVPTASLEKSQTVSAPDGSTMVVRGAVITYAIVARFEGSGTARAVTVTDQVPSGTVYVAGSLSLDDSPLTDAADTDPGSFSSDGISVALGDVARAATHTIRFKVKIL